MPYDWPEKRLTTVDEIFACLAELLGKSWICRGQSKHYKDIMPKIDRCGGETRRIEKLKLERQSIDLFRATARFFSHPGEANGLIDDNIALAVLRHYGVPTRLLDWTRSPYVAAYFAVCDHDHDKEHGEILSFDYRRYVLKGQDQWRKQPETTTDGSGDHDKFQAQLTQFSTDEKKYNWIICMFYPTGFPRQNAQQSLYTLTAQFGCDHAERMKELLDDSSCYCRYVISKDLKPELQKRLLEDHGIWRGSLFPDTGGAAETVRQQVFKCSKSSSRADSLQKEFLFPF